MTEKLSREDRDLLALIKRSPDVGERWRKVSKMLWPVVFGRCSTRPALVEVKHSDDGESGFIRLTEEGETVMRYL